MIVFMLAQATWWIIFIAHLVDEKVDLAREYGADPETLNLIRQEEISRQIMIGLEGVFFLILIFISFWLIYQSYRKSQELKFHQQNFLMAVTHELKTPLASLNVYLDNLKSPKVAEDTKGDIYIKMKDDIRRLNGLVEDVLSAGRFDRADFIPEKESINFSSFLRERIEYLKHLASVPQLEINSDLKDNIFLSGDKKSLARAINAILENALKYAVNDHPIIDIRLKSAGQYLELSISDNGPGIAEKDLDNIFERFYRVGDEMTRKTGGTGLGLYLCREVIKAHNGKIRASSKGDGKGTTFTITLKKDSSN